MLVFPLYPSSIIRYHLSIFNCLLRSYKQLKGTGEKPTKSKKIKNFLKSTNIFSVHSFKFYITVMRDKILNIKVALRIFVENQEQAYNLRDFEICFISPLKFLIWTKLVFPLYPSFWKASEDKSPANSRCTVLVVKQTKMQDNTSLYCI